MAKSTGLGDKLFSEGNDLSGDAAVLNRIETMVSLLDSTSIEDSSATRFQGRSDGALDFNVYFNDVATHGVLSALPSTNIGLYYARGVTLGNAMAFIDGRQVGYAGTRGADGAFLLGVTVQADGNPLEWGTQISAGKITHASAGSSTGEVTSQTTVGGVGFLEGFEVDSGTATVVIEDSSDTADGDDGVWGTLLTFATDSDSWPAAERKTVTGTVEKGLRVTTTGTFTNADFAVGFRRGMADDREDLSS